MQTSHDLLLGCDPEWFLTDGTRAISAINRFTGTKEQPVPLQNGVTVQVDNCAVEYGTTPAASAAQWLDLNCSAREQIGELAAKQGLQLHIVPSVIFEEDQLDDERAWIFGCDPDFNAWDLAWNPKPKADNPMLRSAGGHVHFGTTLSKQEVIQLGRLADMTIALPGLLADFDDQRRLLYGKAGAIRYKKYGMEWRTGSNFWTLYPHRIDWLYRQAQLAVKMLRDGFQVPVMVREVIDTGDRDGARYLCDHYGIEVPA